MDSSKQNYYLRQSNLKLFKKLKNILASFKMFPK